MVGLRAANDAEAVQIARDLIGALPDDGEQEKEEIRPHRLINYRNC